MIDEKYIELMNREIDNIITPDEKNTIRNYLAENAEAEEYFNGLRLTADSLNRLTDPVPSVNLKKKIINSINFNKYIPTAKPDSTRKSYWIFRFRYAYTFAAGLIAGLIIYSIFSINSSTVIPDEISGTMGITENTVTLREIPITSPSFSGNISILRSEKNFWFKVNSNSLLPVDLTISYPDQLHFENIKPGKSGNLQLTNGKNYIKITNSGSQQYTVMFTKNDLTTSPVHFRLYQSGKKIYESEIALNR